LLLTELSPQVGDCWLLSAISALAEFDGAVRPGLGRAALSEKEVPDTVGNLV
jgi:hypothetical protein